MTVSPLTPLRQSTADIVETVLGVGNRERAGRLPVAGLAALVAHVSIVLGLMHVSLAPRRAADTSRVQPPQQLEIDVAKIPPSVSAKAESEPPAAARRSAPPKARDTRTPRARPSGTEAAQAATVVAQQPDPGAPVDLTADAVVTGTATAYAGGATAPGGASPSVVTLRPSAADAQGPALAPATRDRSGPVTLESEHWSCPWPPEADAQQIDEQTVVLRVVVEPDGVAEAATVLADPGHGFGPAAAACAMRTRFTPARNRRGERLRSTSPPIRVRFTR
jgi:protein TonB